MEYNRLKTTIDNSRFIFSTSDNFYCRYDNTPHPCNEFRSLSVIGTDTYNRSLRRAFARAKLLAFFNPDLTNFITLTYAQLDNTPKQVIQDIKLMLLQNKRNLNSDQNLKYIYILELQERGSIHIHMICNNCLITEKNKNGYLSVKYWDKGFSSVKTIIGTDVNFKPYLYLFKYMTKAQRVGNSFIHCSRNFDKILTVDYADYITKLAEGDILYSEDFNFRYDEKLHTISKKYISLKKN